MIEDFLNYVGTENLEETALLVHRPSNAVYVFVNESGDYKIVENWEKVSYNSKYKGLDYYSQLVSMNKPIASKLIQSNNYNAFWCKNTKKLTDSDIDGYFDSLDYHSWHRDWVKQHIYGFGERFPYMLIKIFFDDSREEYRRLGLENWLEKAISVPPKMKKFGNSLGVPIGYSINAKKPYANGRTLYVVDQEKGLHIKLVYDILKGLTKRGYNIIYVNELGIFPTSLDHPIDRDLPSSLFLLTAIDDKGQVVIKQCETIPTYQYWLR